MIWDPTSYLDGTSFLGDLGLVGPTSYLDGTSLLSDLGLVGPTNYLDGISCSGSLDLSATGMVVVCSRIQSHQVSDGVVVTLAPHLANDMVWVRVLARED